MITLVFTVCVVIDGEHGCFPTVLPRAFASYDECKQIGELMTAYLYQRMIQENVIGSVTYDCGKAGTPS